MRITRVNSSREFEIKSHLLIICILKANKTENMEKGFKFYIYCIHMHAYANWNRE